MTTMIVQVPKCEGCGNDMDTVGILQNYTVCFDCTRARQRAVALRRCSCRKKRPSEVKKIGSRSWISCLKCLGQIKQLS